MEGQSLFALKLRPSFSDGTLYVTSQQTPVS
jgi:hypothetical protein